MRCLYRFRLGARTLPIEMGRRLRMARVARVCPLCTSIHVGDERHYVFECPAFNDICCGFRHLFYDSCRAIRPLKQSQGGFTAIALHCSTIDGDSQHRLPPLALEAPRWTGHACIVSREQQLPVRSHFS